MPTAPAYQRHTIMLPLAGGDTARAAAHARRAMAAHADTPHNPLWSSEQIACNGYLAEIAFRRHLGEPADLPLDLGEGEPDVRNCQVKSAAWLSPAVMDRWQGGHLYVPLAPQAPVIVLVVMFPATMHRRVFYEGWLPSSEAAAWPVADGYRPAYAVPYMALRPPWVPLPAGPGATAAARHYPPRAGLDAGVSPPPKRPPPAPCPR